MTRIRTGLLAAALCTPLVAQVGKGAWTPAVENHQRGYTSISFWTIREDGKEIGGGRVSIDYGQPRWRAAFDDEEAFDRFTKGRIWRLGRNKWTLLDTQLPLRFGRREVEPGFYYLGARRKDSGDWTLVFVDPEAVRPKLIDAWAFVPRPDEVPILFEVPLKHARAPESSRRLDISLSLEPGRKEQAALEIHWGPHTLQTPFQILTVPPDFYRNQR